MILKTILTLLNIAPTKPSVYSESDSNLKFIEVKSYEELGKTVCSVKFQAQKRKKNRNRTKIIRSHSNILLLKNFLSILCRFGRKMMIAALLVLGCYVTFNLPVISCLDLKNIPSMKYVEQMDCLKAGDDTSVVSGTIDLNPIPSLRSKRQISSSG